MCRVTDNLGLARKIAYSYSKYKRDMYDDLYQEACVGLIEADKTYIEGQTQFSTHATNVMNFKIMYYLENNNTPGVTSRSAGKVAMQIRKKGIENNSVESIAKELNISKQRIVAVLQIMKNKASLDSPMNGEEDSTLSNIIKDDTFGNLIIHEDGLNKLNDLQKKCFKMHIMGYKNKEISTITGLNCRFVGKAINYAKEVLKEWAEVL